jgi:hypothetical protein
LKRHGRLPANHLHERAIEHAVLPWCEQQAHAGQPPACGYRQARDATTRQIALAFLTRRPSVSRPPKRPASSMSKRMPARPIYSCRRPRSHGLMPLSRVVSVAAGCRCFDVKPASSGQWAEAKRHQRRDYRTPHRQRWSWDKAGLRNEGRSPPPSRAWRSAHDQVIRGAAAYDGGEAAQN